MNNMVKTRSESDTATKAEDKTKDMEQLFDEKLSTLASRKCIEELKTLIMDQNKKIEEQNEKIKAQDEKIQQQEVKINKQGSKLNILRDRMAVLSGAIDYLKACSDNQEQYSRRSCLRINGTKR